MLIYCYGFKGNCDFSEAILMSKLGDRSNSGNKAHRIVWGITERQPPNLQELLRNLEWMAIIHKKCLEELPHTQCPETTQSVTWRWCPSHEQKCCPPTGHGICCDMENTGHTAGHLQPVRPSRDRDRRSLGPVSSSHISSVPAIGSLTGGMPCTGFRIEESKLLFWFHFAPRACAKAGMCSIMSRIHLSADLCLWLPWGEDWSILESRLLDHSFVILIVYQAGKTAHFLQGALQGIIQRVLVASQDREKEFGMQLGCKYYSASPHHFCLLTIGYLFQISSNFSELANNGMCDLLQCMNVQVGR